ncbi:MAG: hypothetical protein QM270_00790 [Bacillota bacterium]|nr:hypothetical protein [Bacillota bacterium]
MADIRERVLVLETGSALLRHIDQTGSEDDALSVWEISPGNGP